MRHKLDEPPLLAPGRHRVTIEQLRALCVDPFHGNPHRADIFTRFVAFVRRLNDLAIPCELMVDGSFLTSKPHPTDLDVAVKLDHDVAEKFSFEQRDFIDQINASEQLMFEDVDAFAYVSYPRGHDLFGTPEDEGETWAEQYGIEHGKVWLKGLAVVYLGENDVGLRVRS